MKNKEPIPGDPRAQRGDGLSSHWNIHYQHETWKSTEFGVRDGLGIFVPRKGRRVLLHHLMQVPLLLRFGRHYKPFLELWRAGRRICKAHNRAFDSDDLRQVLSVSCALHHVPLPPGERRVIAIIGDGYARIANLLLATRPKCLIVLVNLPPSLEVDLLSLRTVSPAVRVLRPERAEDLRDLPPDLNVIAIAADKAELLATLPVEGAFNTSSMQEMDLSTIRNYFRLLRATPSRETWFYCANAVEKKWVDGSVIRFSDYPWQSQDRVLVDEICPWAHLSYFIFPPKYLINPFRIQQRLAYLAKG
jgi:hypothetical protein